jgi:hypothetical protein
LASSIESVLTVFCEVKLVHEQMAQRNTFLPMSPVQSVLPGMGITPWPIQKASRPASMADPELVVIDPVLLLLIELELD